MTQEKASHLPTASVPTPLPQSIVRLRGVIALTGLSRSSIYAMSAKGQFPKSIRLGARAVGWKLCAIQDWIDTRTSTDTAWGSVEVEKLIAPDSGSATLINKNVRGTSRYIAPPSQRNDIGASASKTTKLKTDITQLEHIVKDGKLHRFSAYTKVSDDSSWHVLSADTSTARKSNARGR